MRNVKAGRALKWSGLCALVVGCALSMGQGCPAPTPPATDNEPPVTTNKPFVGAQECRICHSRHYDDWSLTKHAGALATLTAAGQDTNADCLPCHVVGYGQPGGFVDAATTPELANVQCENCHGAAGEHRRNVDNVSLRPPRNIAAAVCGTCHTDVHHPTYEEWKESGHSTVTADPAASFVAGSSLTRCGICHSGDYREKVLVEGLTLTDASFQGQDPATLNAVTCVICHDPHKATGFSAGADPGEDFQLRFPEVADPVPSNVLADAQNSARFNLCGQCHRSREATWQTTTRPPHHSVQANMYTGEMPIPDGTTALVVNQRSVHRFVPKQCVSCHMPTAEFESTEQPADSGHRFVVGFTNCSGTGCHASVADAQAIKTTLQTEIQNGLNTIKTRLGDPLTWEYSSNGGPAVQTGVSPLIKQVRFEYYYVLNDLSMGVHNPGYTRAILADASARLTQAGK
jgi:hypothetical protein